MIYIINFHHRRRSAPELKKVADNTTDSEDEADIDDPDDDVYLPPTSTNSFTRARIFST